MAQVLAARLARVHCAVEAVHHRHNISAILRTCDALGIHHVHLVGTGRFKVSPGAARGAERWLQLHHHPDAAAAISHLRGQQIRIFVADLQGAPVPPEEVPVQSSVCLWFGAELVGVSDAAREAADGVVMLPMHGFAQSLNVSVAAALALRPVAERARALGSEALLPAATQAELLQAWVARDRSYAAAIADRGRGS